MFEFSKIVEQRRSIRIFDGKPVPEDVIQRSLDLALQSPSSSNMQPWEFFWVRSVEPKAELIKICLSQPAAATAGELIVCVARTGAWDRARMDTLAKLQKLRAEGVVVPEPAMEYYQKISKLMYTQGWMSWAKRVMFFFQALKGPTMRAPVNSRQMEVWAVKSTALACQTLMLAFQAEGYDTCPMEGFDSGRLRKLLALPRDAYPVMVLGVGKARPSVKTLPRLRANRDWFVKTI